MSVVRVILIVFIALCLLTSDDSVAKYSVIIELNKLLLSVIIIILFAACTMQIDRTHVYIKRVKSHVE